MDWAALMIITLLIVAIVGFLALLVLILQYYTVTKETRAMKENIYLSKMEFDYALEQHKAIDKSHNRAVNAYDDINTEMSTNEKV